MGRGKFRGGRAKLLGIAAPRACPSNHDATFNKQHGRCLLRDYVAHYNAERVHTQLKDAPVGRSAETRPSPDARVADLTRAPLECPMR